MGYNAPNFGAGGGFHPATVSGSSGPTTLQQLEQKYIKSQQHPHHSLLGKVFHSATHGFETGLGMLSRPDFAISGGVDAAIQGHDILHAMGQGIKGKAHVGYGQVLQDSGVLKHHNFLRGLAGFALDVGLDPLLPLAFVGAPEMALGRLATRGTEMGLAKGILGSAADTARTAMRGGVVGPNDFGRLEASRNLLQEAGTGFEAHTALANAKLEALNKIFKLGKMTEEDRARIQGAEVQATVEHKALLGPRNIHVGYGFGKNIAKVSTHIGTPSLKKFAEMNVPPWAIGLRTTPKIADALGKAFKNGWDNPDYHALSRFSANDRQLRYEQGRTEFNSLMHHHRYGENKLTPQEMAHALAWARNTEGVVNPGSRTFNLGNFGPVTKALKAGEISTKQVGFLQDWHKFMEYMRKGDLEAGVKYDKSTVDAVSRNTIYVPSPRKLEAGAFRRSPNILSKQRHTYAKVIKNNIEPIEDPMSLALNRLQMGVQGQSDALSMHIMAASTGIAARVPHTEMLAKIAAEREARQTQMEGLDLLEPGALDSAKQSVAELGHAKHEATLARTAERFFSGTGMKPRGSFANLGTKAKNKLSNANSIAITKSKIRNTEKQIAEHYAEFKGTKLAGVVHPLALEKKLALQKQTLEKQYARWNDTVLKLEKRRDMSIAVKQDALDAKYENQLDRGNWINKRIAGLDVKTQMHQLSKTNPEIAKRGYEVITRLRHPNGGSLAVPADVSAALKRASASVPNDPFLREFRNGVQRVTSKWKTAVTVVNPGFTVRNAMSHLWNVWLNGMPIHFMPSYTTKAIKLMNSKDPRDLALLNEAYRHGVYSGIFRGDVQRSIEALHSGETRNITQLAKSGHLIQAAAKTASKASGGEENMVRLMQYLYLRDHGMNGTEAGWKVIQSNFDYQDLTATERNIKSHAMPFYTWTRKNVPFQVSMMFQHPGRYAAMPLLFQEMEQASGSKGLLTPDWMKKELAFHVPFGGKGNMVTPRWGISDIEKLQHPQKLLELLSPWLKLPIEYSMNRSMLTGAPVYGKELPHPRAPITNIAADLLKFLPGANVGQTARNVSGKEVYSKGANPAYTYLFDQTPLGNLLGTQLSSSKQASRGNKALMSYLTGLSQRIPNQDQEITARSMQEQTAFKQLIRGLRDEQKIAENKRKKSTYQQNRLQQIANG